MKAEEKTKSVILGPLAFSTSPCDISFMFILESQVSQFQSWSSEGKSIEECLVCLRELGMSAMQSVMIVKSVLGIPLVEADRIVIYSEAWADQLALTLALREDFFSALESLSEQEIPDL